MNQVHRTKKTRASLNTVAYATANTVYYVRDRICLRVYSLSSRRWLANHPAILQELSGGVRDDGYGRKPILAAQVGDGLWFESVGLVTSPIQAIFEIIESRACA